MPGNLANALECLLFVAEEPLPPARLAALLAVTESEVAGLADDLSRGLDGRGLQLVRIAGGYKLTTRPEYASWVEKFREPDPQRLSKAALETLAIIAYRQPVTQPEIEAIRGVDSSGVVSKLLDKGLIAEAGRKLAPGRPFLYRTTTEFLTAFGLPDLSELPMLEALRQASEAAFGVNAPEEPELSIPALDTVHEAPPDAQTPQEVADDVAAEP